MRTTLLLLLLAGCASVGAPGETGFRSSSSTKALDQPVGPAAYTPTNQIDTPMAGISKRCTLSPSGLGADCRALP